jgi:hypothetical protein
MPHAAARQQKEDDERTGSGLRLVGETIRFSASAPKGPFLIKEASNP